LVICRASAPPSLGTNVFNNTHSSLQIRIPTGSVATYMNATNWKEYISKIVGF